MLCAPCQVLFWRPSRETLVRHRCPLWDATIGLTPSRVLAVDMLHTYYLGSLQVWGACAIWALLLSGVWGAFEPTAEERRMGDQCLLVRAHAVLRGLARAGRLGHVARAAH
eukprot:2233455-Alexandrium_andersonii.AAC.1